MVPLNQFNMNIIKTDINKNQQEYPNDFDQLISFLSKYHANKNLKQTLIDCKLQAFDLATMQRLLCKSITGKTDKNHFTRLFKKLESGALADDSTFTRSSTSENSNMEIDNTAIIALDTNKISQPNTK